MIGYLVRVKPKGMHRGGGFFWKPIAEHVVGIIVGRSTRHGVSLLTSERSVIDVNTKQLQIVSQSGT